MVSLCKNVKDGKWSTLKTTFTDEQCIHTRFQFISELKLTDCSRVVI